MFCKAFLNVIYLFDRYENSEEVDQIITMTKECLLQGLSDENLKNRYYLCSWHWHYKVDDSNGDEPF